MMPPEITPSPLTCGPTPPRVIAWELTRRCRLKCRHCRAAAEDIVYRDELTTDECRRLLENIAAFARPTMIVTGGEPLLREDVFDIIAFGHERGLRIVLATCGNLLTTQVVAKLKASGIECVSISLDGASAPSHDAFRGVAGAFDAAMKGIEALKAGELAFQINTTLTKGNINELPALLELARQLGAITFNPFLLVPTGRGETLKNMELSPQQYEETLQWLAHQQARGDIPIRVTCAPHYQRILREQGAIKPGERPQGGCLGGKSFVFISHTGKVQICGFLETEAGRLRENGFNFEAIWRGSPFLQQIRDVDGYHGKCGLCEYRRVCGGCRARAYAMTGDVLAEEPFCTYQPGL